MLMVGEAVLQLVLGDTTDGMESLAYNESLVAGFVLALAMLYTWNVTEPHHQAGHAFARASRPAALYLLLVPAHTAVDETDALGAPTGLFEGDAHVQVRDCRNSTVSYAAPMAAAAPCARSKPPAATRVGYGLVQ